MNFKKAGIFRRSSEGSEQPEVQNDSGGMLAVWGSQWKDGNGGENRKNAFRQKKECYSSALRHDCPHASLHLFAG